MNSSGGGAIELTPEQIRRAVDAYDAARCRMHGHPLASHGMSERNKQSIAPMIEAAIRAALEADPEPPPPEPHP